MQKQGKARHDESEEKKSRSDPRHSSINLNQHEDGRTGDWQTPASSELSTTRKKFNHAAGSCQATVLSSPRQSDHQNPSAPRIKRVHTRVALMRSLVRAAWLMVELKT